MTAADVAARGHGRRDVVVVGGGPAGAAAAALLARRGRAVTLVHRPPGRRQRLGETVPGGVVTPLVALGVWEAFLAARHVPAPGTVASWGGPTPHERDAVFDAYGCGWHLDRTGFDAMLLAAAEDAGAQVLPATIVGCRRAPDDGWTLRMAGPGPTTLQARWIVDASGRGARIARHEVGRTRHDRLLALARFYRTPEVDDTRTAVEATEAGWWYTVPLPGEKAVAVFFTDVDLIPRGAAERTRTWDELLAATRLVRHRLGPTTAASSLRSAPAGTGALDRACGPGWLAVGDAAQSWDPLSGQGVLTALGSALAAADALEPGQPLEPAMERYAEWVRAAFREYLRQRSVQYGRERRWAGSPFWRRRSGPGLTSRGVAFVDPPREQVDLRGRPLLVGTRWHDRTLS